MAESQCRNFSLVTYLSENQLNEVLQRKSEYIKAFSYCVHDMDKDKEKHTHIILLLNSPRYVSTVKNWFNGYVDDSGNTVNTLCQKCHNVTSAFDYLIHKDNPEKYQYDPCLRITSDLQFFSETSDNEDVAKLALFDLLDGVPLREVAKRYGRDFIYHYGHIKDLLHDILCEEENLSLRNDINNL